MKKIALFTLVFVLMTAAGWAQRFAFVDSEYIMENIPEVQAAEMEIEQLSIEWQQEIEERFAEIDRLYREYQAEAPLLPEEMRQQREELIIEREKEAKDLQMQRFGREGDLFQKRQELIQPIQDRIHTTVEEIATRGNYAIIFDKAGGVSMLFTDMRYDLSDDVLQQMGYRR
ncbi:MAG: OmpH family outer membrane protein [Bacteroidales bacterium]